MSSPERTPTAEQAAVIAGASAGKGSLMVEAGAGCAKTTTLEMASKVVRVPALSLAFNKSIAAEMTRRFPGNFQIKTLNGLGHGAWMRTVAGSVKLDERKTGKLVSQVARDRRVELSSEQWDGLRQLVSWAQLQGLVPRGDLSQEATLVEDSLEGWLEVGVAAGVSPSETEWGWELAREVLQENNRLAREGTISFDDQVYCSTMLGGRFPRFPVVFVDEDQDLSPLQIKMISQAMAPDARMLAVGDSRQAIYAWRGASGQASSLLRGLRPLESWGDFPLLTSFRCPKTVVARQQGHIPGFRAFEGNPIGHVQVLDGERGWDWETIQGKQKGSLAILCRNNAPLLAMAFKLLRAGIGVKMLGRDIGKNLVALSKKISPEDSASAEVVLAGVAEWQAKELAFARSRGLGEASLDSIGDRAECLVAVLQSTEARNAGELRAVLQKLFARVEGLVTLSSIHRAKGLEWDTVLHLDPWRCQQGRARALARGNQVQAEQEANLVYVAETRTREVLLLASLEGFQGG